MFPSRNRLRLRAEKDFFQTSSVIRLPTLSAYYRYSKNKFQVAVRVRKVTAKLATKRHSLKRKIISQLALSLKLNPVLGQLLIVTGKNCNILNWPAVSQDLKLLWSKLILIGNSKNKSSLKL